MLKTTRVTSSKMVSDDKGQSDSAQRVRQMLVGLEGRKEQADYQGERARGPGEQENVDESRRSNQTE